MKLAASILALAASASAFAPASNQGRVSVAVQETKVRGRLRGLSNFELPSNFISNRFLFLTG
jgi:hypothetical protein